jgi:hypothetical protein
MSRWPIQNHNCNREKAVDRHSHETAAFVVGDAKLVGDQIAGKDEQSDDGIVEPAHDGRTRSGTDAFPAQLRRSHKPEAAEPSPRRFAPS